MLPIHNRQSTRLKGYDYSMAGLYFVTICTHNRECLFGHIADDDGRGGKFSAPVMILNETGKIANECWLQIPEHFPNAVLHEHIIMPNHVHGIIELTNVGTHHNAGARHDVGARHGVPLRDNTDISVGASHGMPLPPPSPKINQFGKPISGSLSVIINQYKSSVKRWCNKNGQEQFKWQRNYHDHIIRNEQSYQTISNYIISNPAKWNDDKFFRT